ncbi:MAG: hypothetical protein ACI86X_002153 [Moritella sp.]|jgi:uncharacterized protein YbgA (DUF1722 family)/uncharacterized protein YbbK (DUF523 family)
MKIKMGISACVYGHQVRFDSGHKTNYFCKDVLTDYCDFTPFCPEVGIGMSVPRPTIRLVLRDGEERLVMVKDQDQDFTEKMKEFADNAIPEIADMCGYVVCAKSPTCGMERVKLYNEKGHSLPGGTTGVYTRRLQQALPWLPIEEDGRLQDSMLRENFVIRIMALHNLYTSTEQLTAANIIQFHSRYKYLLMACNLVGYKSLGQFVGHIAEHDINAFFVEYRLRFMNILKKPATRKGNVNVLQHMQGYFKKSLTAKQKQELSDSIMRYHRGYLPLLAPLTLINHYLSEHPNPYLSQQVYLDPYPQEMKLRYAM